MTQSQQSKIFWGWILTLSPIGIGVLRFINMSVFFAIGAVHGDMNINVPLAYEVTKNAINFVLGLLSFMTLFIGLPIGIILLVLGYGNTKPKIQIQRNDNDKVGESIYQKDFDVSKLSHHDQELMKEHDFKQVFSPGLVAFLHMITFGLFGVIYYGLAHDRFPRIRHDDFGSGKAIGFMFIPLFNLYRIFIFRLKLMDRINLQYKLRNKPSPISRGFVLTTTILGIIPYLNIVTGLILEPILMYQLQSAINKLIKEDTSLL